MPESSAGVHSGEGVSPYAGLVTIQEFGGWAVAQKVHFADGGMFGQIYQAAR